eukprot:TRINITY_DN3601_c0_g1_i1.p1 TRINITY_DN3601_c0_g1~~TRINITY_DN3601_c0_g1_i1.p1  ORF type:complete len:74 (-),score=6.87 TRINITY_DN3601_c0_g1_i1:331-552(-)
MSEACTGRSFSLQKPMHQPRRANLSYQQVEQQLFSPCQIGEKFVRGQKSEEKTKVSKYTRLTNTTLRIPLLTS